MIRTTITLPDQLHEELRIQAFKTKSSLSDVVVKKLWGEKAIKKEKKSLDKQIEREIAFFRKIQRMKPQFDAAKAVREERDRDNA